MKFAIIIMFELRSFYKTIDFFSKYLIDFYNADIFIVCQEHFPNDSEKLKYFEKYGDRVKICKLYKKPDLSEYFGKECIHFLKKKFGMGAGFSTPACLQAYINHYEAAKCIKPYVNDYDYFIIMRIDINILFEFPPIEFFENQLSPAIYTFRPKYAYWGGSGLGNFIHKNFIIQYLEAYYDRLLNFQTINDNFNQENFLTHSLKCKNLQMVEIIHINYFYTADDVKSYTTWSKPVMHPKYNVVCKYIPQVDEACANLKLWENGYRWCCKTNVHLGKK